MDSKFQPKDFTIRMHDSSLAEVMSACDREMAEAEQYDPQDQVEVCYIDVYKSFLKNLKIILTTGQRPQGIDDHDLEKTRLVVERLVAHKELDPEVLNMYVDMDK